MTLNARTRQGQRYLRKHGAREVIIDGEVRKTVWFTDMRRKIAKAYLTDEKGQLLLNDRRDDVLSETIKAKTISVRRIGEFHG